MPQRSRGRTDRRRRLIEEIEQLADRAVFGTLSETYRTCGTPGCHCHGAGPKHGPHLYVSYRSDGKTTGYYVPRAAQREIREGVAAWQTLLQRLRELAELNKERALAQAKEARTR
jgi:hypothetical protein